MSRPAFTWLKTIPCFGFDCQIHSFFSSFFKKSSFKFLLLINTATFELDLFSSSAFLSGTNHAQFALTGKCAAQLPSALHVTLQIWSVPLKQTLACVAVMARGSSTPLTLLPLCVQCGEVQPSSPPPLQLFVWFDFFFFLLFGCSRGISQVILWVVVYKSAVSHTGIWAVLYSAVKHGAEWGIDC